MIIKLTFSIISLSIITLFPILFFMAYKKRNNAKFDFWSFLIGVVVCFLCKDVLLKIIVNGLLIIPYISTIITSTIYSIFVTSIIAALLFVGALILVKKVYYKNSINSNNIISLFLGMVFAEALLSYIMPTISNIIFVVQMNNGTLYPNLIKILSDEQALTVIKLYEGFKMDYFIYYGIAFSFVVLAYYMIVSFMAKVTDNRALVLSMFIMVIVENVIIYATNPLINGYSILFLLLVIIALLIIINKMSLRKAGA